MMHGLLGDVRAGVRALTRRSGSTAFAVLMLAVGIGSATAVYSVVYGIVLRPLPFLEPDRLVVLSAATPTDPADNWSGPDFLDVSEQASLLNGVAASRMARFALQGGPSPEEVRGASVTGAFFDVLGVGAQMGQAPRADSRRPETGRVVVLSHGLWQGRFGADPDVVGTSVVLDDQAYTVAGVMPRGFDYPHGASLWTLSRFTVPEPPFDFGDNPERLRTAHYFDVFARLRAGATLEQASEQLVAVMADLERRFPDANAGRRARLVPMLEAQVGNVQSALWILLGAVVSVLLIGCANVASLLFIRGADREREILIRIAVGASLGRLVRQFLIESVLLGCAGGVIGVLLASWGVDGIVALIPRDVPRLPDVGLSLPVLAFALVTALLSSMLAGVAPAWHAAARRSSGSSLATGSRASAARVRRVLVTAEVALSAVLLVGAVLMIRTMSYLATVDPGFRVDSTVAARVFLPSPRYEQDEQIRGFFRGVLDRLRAAPGITSAGAVMSLPVDAGGSADLRVRIAGRSVTDRAPVAGFQSATSGYFETMGIPLLSGRLFSDDDREGRPLVAVVSEAFARRFFQGASPIGERLTWSDPTDPGVQWFTIVGVVGNTRHTGVQRDARAEAYVPSAQAPIPYLWLVARGELGVESTTRAIRAAVSAVDGGRPLSVVLTLDQVLSQSLAQPRLSALVLSVFAVLAIVMAAFGLYGVLAYSVTRRATEIGIRMALGAPRSRVVRHILRDGSWMAGAGLAVGMPVALALSRFMGSQLHGVRVTDPLTLGTCCLVLGAATVLAALVPALRASRVDPAALLRSE